MVEELLKDPEVREQVERHIASDETATRRVNQTAARIHSSPESIVTRPKPSGVDYDTGVQDAAAFIVYRLADFSLDQLENLDAHRRAMAGVDPELNMMATQIQMGAVEAANGVMRRVAY